MLTACASSGPSRAGLTLAQIPADIRACLAKVVPAPLPGAMSRAQAAALMAAFRKSDLAKTHCGKRLIAWYDAQVKALAK